MRQGCTRQVKKYKGVSCLDLVRSLVNPLLDSIPNPPIDLVRLLLIPHLPLPLVLDVELADSSEHVPATPGVLLGRVADVVDEAEAAAHGR